MAYIQNEALEAFDRALRAAAWADRPPFDPDVNWIPMGSTGWRMCMA